MIKVTDDDIDNVQKEAFVPHNNSIRVVSIIYYLSKLFRSPNIRKIWIKCEYMVNEAIKTTWDVPDSLCPPVTHVEGKFSHIKVFFMIQHLFPVSTWVIFSCVSECVCVCWKRSKFNHQALSSEVYCCVKERHVCVCACLISFKVIKFVFFC